MYNVSSFLTRRAGKHGVAGLIGILITLLMCGVMLLKLTALETLEAKLLDYRFKLRGPLKPPGNIVIAAIDEKSIDRLGRWPWDRDRLAGLVRKLNAAGAAIIVFDIILSEHEKNDPLLSAAIEDAANVILPIAFDFEKKSAVPANDLLFKYSLSTVINPERLSKYNPISADRALVPVATLLEQAMSVGHINMFPDNDGTLRWEAMVIGYGGYLFPSVTLQAAAAYLGVPQDKIVLSAAEGVKIGKRFVPTDYWGRTLIDYYGPEQTFSYLSISDILDGAIKQEQLQGKIVLVGATAVGIYDLRVTPFSAAMPGIEKQASVIASILDNRLLKNLPWYVNLLLLLLSGIMAACTIPRFKALGAVGVTCLLFILILVPGYLLFVQKGLWIAISYPLLNVLLIFISVTGYNYAREERYARKIRAMFSSYVTERIVNELIKNPDMAKLGGERREISILFSDVRGFTSFSEKHTPEEVVSILNEYLGAMTSVVFKWEGTLDKFIGDAILAFWGAPMHQENHAELAVKCSLEMISVLQQLRQKWLSEGKPVLDCGIGLNTGEVIVGNIGAEGKKMDYTVIGDHVNLGSRVESLTRKYNVHILMTEFTLDKIRDKIEDRTIMDISVKGLERVVVKGKEKPVEIYELASLEPGQGSVVTRPPEEKVVVHKEK
ncbi:MAG: adenylate/guanylate cyclase domain-containing protein [Nitrospirae bacterium]|nr:adenylate/guanylate cyclase domain-containing protein [Nitrospirota bacterium]